MKRLTESWSRATFIQVAPILLFVVSVVFGVLEVHFSTDTWINLASGRQILTSTRFPTHDPFSYTASGEVWLNQNWLTHIQQFWLYRESGPGAVVWGSWGLAASIFVLSLVAAYLRSGVWWISCLAASIVAIGCRDFLSARAATTGYFCAAAQWMLLSALEGQERRRRWWPIVLLAPLQLIWTMAHGSFLLGYGVLLIYVAHWLLARRASRAMTSGKQAMSWQPVVISGSQALAVVAVMVSTFVLSGLFGPFHWDNFFHFDKIAGSSLWRSVYEWKPVPSPLDPLFKQKLVGGFPPMIRFCWIASGLLVLAGLLAAVQLRARRRFARGTSRARTERTRDLRETSVDRSESTPTVESGSLSDGTSATPTPSVRSRFVVGPVELLMLTIGLVMTVQARRFAPLFYIYAAPFFAAWIVRARGAWSVQMLDWARPTAAVAALLAAVIVGSFTVRWAHRDLVESFRRLPELDLLERVTRCDQVPREAIEYLARNELSTNLACSWANAGIVMFHAPSSKVFIDGRAQSVYQEVHFRAYTDLMVEMDTPLDAREAILDGAGLPVVDGRPPQTDAVLLWRDAPGQHMMELLASSRRWSLAMASVDYALFLRVGSTPLKLVAQMDRRGREWRPANPYALACLGNLHMDAVRPSLDGDRTSDAGRKLDGERTRDGERTSDGSLTLVGERSVDGEQKRDMQPDLERALQCWLPAVNGAFWVGELCYENIARVFLDLDRPADARLFFKQQREVLRVRGGEVPAAVRLRIENALGRAESIVVDASE